MEKDLKKIALKTIEALTSEDWTEESLKKRMDNIYKFSHCVLGDCKNPHLDWKKELLETYEEFIKNKLI